MKNKYIVCAAIRDYNGTIVCGARHFDTIMQSLIEKLESFDLNSVEQGFIDQLGIFYNRKDALKIAIDAGQINTRRIKTNPIDELFSEDLY